MAGRELILVGQYTNGSVTTQTPIQTDANGNLIIAGSISVGEINVDIDQSDDSIVIYGKESASGPNMPVLVDASGHLQVDVLSGASDATTTDDSTFTIASSKTTPISGVFATDSVDSGDAGAIRMSANRNLFINIRSADGNEYGAGVDSNSRLMVVNRYTAAAAAALPGYAAAIGLSDGTYLQYAKAGASGELQVTDIAVRPGEDAANDRVDVYPVANMVATNPMFVRLSQDGTNAMSATYPLPISATMGANAVGNPIFAEISNGTNGADVLAAIADDVALTNNPLITYGMMGLYDGATMDMARAGASGELQVTDVAVRPGEDAANNRVDVKVVANGTYAPAKTSTATIAASLVDIFASTEILSYQSVTLTVKNTGANPFTNMNVDISPDGTSWHTVASMEGSGNALEAGHMLEYTFTDNSYRYVRIQAAADVSSTTSSDVWLTCRV